MTVIKDSNRSFKTFNTLDGFKVDPDSGLMGTNIM